MFFKLKFPTTLQHQWKLVGLWGKSTWGSSYAQKNSEHSSCVHVLNVGMEMKKNGEYAFDSS